MRCHACDVPLRAANVSASDDTCVACAPADFEVGGGGSVYTVDATNDDARSFIDEHFGLQDWQWLGLQTFAVEHRYIADTVQALRDAGFTVR